jgi:hypothetical protein
MPLSQEIKTSTVLSHVYKELLTATDRGAIMRVLRQSLSAFMGIDALIVLDHEPRRNRLIGRYAAGNAYPFQINRLQIPLSASQCLPVTCHVNGETVNSFSSAHRGETDDHRQTTHGIHAKRWHRLHPDSVDHR